LADVHIRYGREIRMGVMYWVGINKSDEAQEQRNRRSNQMKEDIPHP
jgi:hypothetical protein